MKRICRGLLIVATTMMGFLAALPVVAATPLYHSPLAVVVAPDGKTLYVSDKTAGCIAVIDTATRQKVRDIVLAGGPMGLAISGDGKRLFVAQRAAGSVAVVDTAQGTIATEIPVGPWPVAVAVAAKSNRLVVCNRGDHTVGVVDLAAGKLLKQVPVVRDPVCAVITPDEGRIVVANYMPQGVGTDPMLAAEVSIIDAAKLETVANVKLPAGSTAVSGVCISPAGKWAYAVHAVGRFNLPITQLERGWVHTYALSVIDIPAGTLAATVLLDDLSGGAADPWAVVGSADGRHLWISHAGTHEVSLVDVGRLNELLGGKVSPELAALKDGLRDNVWVRIGQDPRVAAELVNDLTALYIAGAIRRAKSGGLGPRGLALSPDGQTLYVANFFSGTIGVLGAADGKLLGTIALGEQPPLDAARRGEIYFHDAMRCFQHWHSCASCHLDDGRIDGLRWDFMRDKMGNGKDVISLVNVQHTSPHNRRATRPDPRECMRTGVTGSHQIVPQAADIDDLLAYVESLRPEPNPLLPQLAAAAARGKIVFEGKAQCAGCHPAPWFTDQKTHNVGIITDNEPDGLYDTPSLIEAFRTAPYYHDGRAATMKEALTQHGGAGLHGSVKDLSPQEINDLVAYVLSL